jgi:hypothetical protein
MTPIRDDLLRRIGGLGGEPRTRFEAEYRAVQLADALSLHFCGGWPGPEMALGHRVALEGPVLRISPDPFEDATVPLRVRGRRISARRYTDDDDLRRTLAAAIQETVVGEARGG